MNEEVLERSGKVLRRETLLCVCVRERIGDNHSSFLRETHRNNRNSLADDCERIDLQGEERRECLIRRENSGFTVSRQFQP